MSKICDECAVIEQLESEQIIIKIFLGTFRKIYHNANQCVNAKISFSELLFKLNEIKTLSEIAIKTWQEGNK